jgi:hypothetical protein
MGAQLESPSLKHLQELTVRRLLPLDEHLGFGLIELGYLIRPDFGITYGQKGVSRSVLEPSSSITNIYYSD